MTYIEFGDSADGPQPNLDDEHVPLIVRFSDTVQLSSTLSPVESESANMMSLGASILILTICGDNQTI